MEYEKHINNLVLGFLKTNCKSAYKVFLKSHHSSPQKHMSHWVAGQTLEVILTNYSRIQNIVHGCLEDTDYCKEKGVEACSPYYLPEQLLYLLERDRPASPTSTIATTRERSADRHECEDVSDHPSEVEATPTHLLPGNISSIMTKKLLQKTDFHEKLAHNINAALNGPEPTGLSGHDNELENSIKKALSRTEADPVFHDLLEDLLGPVSSQLEKPESVRQEQEQEPVLNGQFPDSARQPQDSGSLQASGLYAYPSQAVARPGNPQQQFYIVNQPILIPQPNPQTMLQQLQSATQALSVDTGQNIRPKAGDQFSEQDIMSMPTIFINDRNELTYADPPSEPSRVPNTVEASTPSVPNEVCNAKEYINAFGMGGPSPIVKKAPKVAPQKPLIAKRRKETKPVSIQPVPSLLIHIVPPDPAPEAPANIVSEPVSEPTVPRSLGSICTPSPMVPASQKPTPKSGSHVRSLQFPSPIRKSSSTEGGADEPPAPDKQQASKDLFNDSAPKPPKSKKETSPAKRKKWAWDAELRSNIVIPKSPPPVKKVRKRTRPVNLDVSDSAGMRLEEALRSPTKADQPKPKKKESGVDVKTVVSPSTLCNTANKRNMEVDGPAEVPKLHARKNINSLLETPMKKEKTVDLAATPLTPMLKANLQGLIDGDTFSIDTPDFPITPGMSLMENSSTAYCMLKESETNKATEAGVLEEEKKSSVRKTDDEELPPSPKVYGRSDTLEAFNRNQTAKKNLELLDKDGVQWETKSDGSEEEESNRTVIRNPNPTHRVTRSAMITRSATGKSMAAIKCQLLQKDRQLDAEVEEDLSPDATRSKKGRADSKKDAHAEDSDVSDKVEKQPSKVKKESRARKDTEKRGKKDSSGSGKTKKDTTTHKRQSGSKDRAPMASKSLQAAEDSAASPSIADEAVPSRPKAKSSKKRQSDVDAKEPDEIKNPTFSSTPEGIKEAIKDNGCLRSSSAKSTCELSLRAEIEEKRQRVIKMVKAETALLSKTPTRRKPIKPKPNLASPRNKRKGAAPKKLLVHGDDDVDYQDEFFKKIGSNLHRTNKQAEADNGKMSSETGSEELRDASLVSDKCQKPQADQQGSTGDSADSSQYYWESCVFEPQPEERVLVFDDKAASGRSLEDYNWNLDNKGFVVSIPLEDEREQSVKITITPARTLWEIPPSELLPEDSSDPEDPRNLKKRKMRSDSCNSNGSTKKIKTSLHPSFLNEQNIEKVLTRLHGPSDKT